MIPEMDHRWTIVQSRVRGKPADLSRLLQRFPSLPAEFVALAGDLTEYELKHQFGQYLRIWPPCACLEMDEAHRISSRIVGSMPVADDGGDRVLIYMHGDHGFGLYRVPFGALDSEEAQFIAPTLAEVLSHSTGVLHDDIW